MLNVISPSLRAVGAAIQFFALDCFASLAMTSKQVSIICPVFSSQSPIAIKSKNSAQGSGFAVSTGPPPSINGCSGPRSAALNGILSCLKISKRLIKSSSQEIEKVIRSISLGWFSDQSVKYLNVCVFGLEA